MNYWHGNERFHFPHFARRQQFNFEACLVLPLIPPKEGCSRFFRGSERQQTFFRIGHIQTRFLLKFLHEPVIHREAGPAKLEKWSLIVRLAERCQHTSSRVGCSLPCGATIQKQHGFAAGELACDRKPDDTAANHDHVMHNSESDGAQIRGRTPNSAANSGCVPEFPPPV